jgi:aspartate dehydrogenase
MIMSVGALMDDQLYNNLVRKASSKRLKIYIPSGAVAGLDAIRCASRELTELTLTTRKHPDSLTGAPYFAKRDLTASSIMEPKVLYSGPAEEAVRLFPANVNVAAVLSLAGLGPTKTLVNVIADPTVDRNIHEITAKGSFGEFRVTMMNRPHPDNPKTSYIAVLSALETLRQYAGRTVHIGT